MSQTGPWSVKGIDSRAREAARERAREEGMTLGEYLNTLILKGGEVGPQDIIAPITQPKPQAEAGANSLNRLVSRIEASEARSTLAITGIDQSVVGLLKRLEDTETEHVAMARHVDGVIDDIRSTHDALQEKVRRMEEDDSAEQNLEALKSLENALGKLASHVYEESSLVQNESEAIKGRVEAGFSDVNERLDSMDTNVQSTLADAALRMEKAVEDAENRVEGTSRLLSERMSSLDAKLNDQTQKRNELESRLEETRSELSATTTSLEDAQSDIADTREKLGETATDVEGAKSDIAETKAELNKTNAQVERARADISNTRAQLNDAAAKAVELKSEVTETRSELGQTAAKVASLTSEVSETKTNLEETAAKIASVTLDVSATKSKLEETATNISDVSENVTAVEGNVRSIADDITSVSGNITAVSERVDGIEGDVTSALETMEGTLLRVQDRLNLAETTTDAALKSLETTFDTLDQRIGLVAEAAPEHADELRQQFDERFNGLADELRKSIEATRAELAAEIENVAISGIGSEEIESFESKINDVQQRLAENTERHERALENVSENIANVSENIDEKISELSTTVEGRIEELELSEGSEKAAEQFSRLSNMVEQRLEQLGEHEAVAIERIGDEMTKIADQLGQRVSDSEQRNASAIEQVGEQVSRVATRLQARQDEALQEFSEKLESSSQRTDARLSDALASVSARLDLMQRQASTTLSPVQKAIASLATRLDSLEEFNTPPFHEGPQAAALPTLNPLPLNKPLFNPEQNETVFDDEPSQSNESADEAAIEAPQVQLDHGSQTTNLVSDFVSNSGNDVEGEEAFTPGVEGWSEIGEETVASSQPQYTSEVPQADIDPVAELENWDDEATEVRESDVFDEFFGADDNIESAATEAPPPPLTNDGSDYISAARAAARDAASPNDISNGKKKEKVGSGKTTKVKQTKTGGSGGNSKLPLVATASVVALAAAGGTAYFALKDNKPLDLQQIDPTPAPTPTITASADTQAAPQSSSTSVDEEIFDDASNISEAPTRLAETPPAPKATAAPTAERAEPVRTAPAPTPRTAPEETVLASAPAPQPRIAIPQIALPETQAAAAANGDSKALFLQAKSKLDNGDYAAGATLMRRAAEGGEIIAQYRYGKLHEKGLGVPRDLSLARQWTERAANGGNNRAMHDLAVFYAQGEGGPQSYAAAVNWFRKAAEFGVVDSQYNLGVLYEKGIGIEPDPSEALFWFYTAARGGDAASQTNIETLSKNLPLATTTSARQRAQSWRPKPAAAIPNGQFQRQSYGSITSSHIRQVQSALNALGFNAGTPDGQTGPATQNAIRAFETRHGLNPTGQVSTRLITKINQVTASRS